MSYLLRVGFFLVVVLSLVVPPGHAPAQVLAASPPECSTAGLPPDKSFNIAPGQAAKLEHDAATLDIGPNAVVNPMTISATSLCQEALPTLDQGMTNVTRSARRGYRFLPHTTFRDNIRVSLPYDKSLIPPGLTEADIKTFYFHEQTGHWKELERVAIDTKQQMIVSLTDHFTDMINATVTVPDHPQQLSYTPTTIKDIKAADPAAEMILVDAPQGTTTGDANLFYPLHVPPGRNGMNPELGIRYNSGGGNGWLGMGWELTNDSISIDTRWGVPRYDADEETETYLINGDQLSPVAHRGDVQPRSSEKIFHRRVEGSFEKIIRHGSNPTNYWWEVVDKTGVRFFYGGSPATNAPISNATLTDDGGHIFKWALREVRDTDGNTILYDYQRVSDVGLSAGTVPGWQLYPKSINYTGFNGSPGAYTILFVRDSELPGYTRRPDVIIDARGGFKMVTAELLKRVDVLFNANLVRRYDFTYQEGAFKKTLLKSATQRGSDTIVFHTHEFTYYNEVQENGSYAGFSPSATWNTGADNVTAGLLNQGQASALSGAISDSVGGHLYLGFNLTAPTKQFSVGGKVGYNHSSNEGVLALLDVNGDSLPDKIFKSGSGYAFRANQSGPDGTTVFGPLQPLSSLPAISKETSNTVSAGPEAYFIANVFANHAETFTTGSVYFSDVNGDGLMDLVSGSSVLFNYLDANDRPAFTGDSNDTPVPVGAGAVDPDGIVDDYESVYQQNIDTFPLHDTLRRWVAPFDGQIQISGPVALVQDNSPARAQYQTADGVRVAIQHNGGELWSTSIGPDDYSAKSPTGVDSIAVQAGDRIFFRVQSVFDGAFDQVAWDPQITYLSVPTLSDVNGLNPYRYQASEDFVLAGRRGVNVQVPLTGTVRLSGDLAKLGVTTDDIALQIRKNGTIVFNQSLTWDQTGSIPLSLDLAVNATDKLELRVKVDSSIDLHKIQWTPQLFYIALPDPEQKLTDDDGNYLFQLHPPYDIDMYPVNNLSAPQQAWVAPQSGLLTVVPQLQATTADANGTVIVTVKKPGARLAKHTITVAGGIVNNGQFDVNVQQGDVLYFDFSAYDPDLGAKLTNKTIAVVFGDPSSDPTTVVPSAFHSAAFPGLFAQPYRGWAYAGYNGNRARATQPIDESRLALDAVFDEDFDPEQDGEAAQDAFANAKSWLFTPFPEQNQWRGTDELGWVSPTTVSSSRFGVDFIDVPRPGDFAGGRAVSRLSRTSQDSVGLGVSFVSGSVSGGELPGSSYGELEFLDMNGDRFPDVVGNGRIQFTTPVGSLEENNRTIDGLDKVRESDSLAGNIGVGGSPAMFMGNSKGDVDTSGKGAPRGNTTGAQMVQLGLSGSLGAGEAETLYDLIDINADGLPDRVSVDGSQLKVAFNLGYSFADPETWGTSAINDGSNQQFSLGASLGYNGGIYDFAGGVSLNKNESETDESLLDINGDGLLDRVRPNGNSLSVAFNTGNGFAAPVAWQGTIADAIATSGNTGLGAGVYFTIGVGPLCWPTPLCYIIINPGVDGSQNMSRQETAILDVNGDGFADQVTSTNDGSMAVASNRTGRTNLLKSVKRPLGAVIDLEYQRDGNTYDLPQSRWNLTKVKMFDGHPGDGVDTQVTTYRYENGRYDRLEREFYGYAAVVAESRDAGNGEALYRSIRREFFNDNFYTKGLLKRELTQDAAGHKFIEREHTYLIRDVATGIEPASADSTSATLFPQLVRTDKRFYEGNAAPGKTTYITEEYDALGNIVKLFDAGDSGAQDDIQATIEYASCSSIYVMSTPTKLIVKGNGVEMRRREATVDCANGNVTQVRQYLANGAAAITDLAYFPNGNIQQVTSPANANGQRFALTYEYDSAVQTYVTRTSDSFGLISTATHDYKFGKARTLTDTNNNTITYDYDNFGRLVTVTGPYEQASGTATIRFEYHPEATVPWALTRHADIFRSATDTINTVMFIDGFKRALQTKKDVTVHTGADSTPVDQMQVSGRVTFDFIGRTLEVYYPRTEALGTPGTFNAAYDSVTPSRMTYDILDRATKVTVPDGSFTTTSYGFGTDRSGTTQFRTQVTDANGKQKRTYRDVRDQITSLQEFNQGGAQVIWTSYEYDPLKQIKRIVDDQNNVSETSYDNLGRRTIIQTPDTGRTEMIYDLASNMVAKITPNLRAQNTQISYDYFFTRLTGIRYPNFSGNNVTYTYGAPGASDNRAGRVTLVVDESGREERFYGKLGEITKEIKTVASDTQGGSSTSPEIYTTQYTYDTFGRLQSLIYPDGEVLTYRYDSGGQVRQAVGQKASHSYDYVKRLEYDKFEQRVFMEAGNNVRTAYSYDPLNRRLDNLQAGRGDGNLFQNLNYSYDNVGNVLGLSNDVPVPPPSQYGGPTVQTYTYDDLYRLTSASGSYEFAPDKINRYSLSLSYNTIHNVLGKQQSHEIVQPSQQPIPQHKTSYNFAYSYDGSQPHAPTHIGERTYTYDANGNQLGWTDDRDGTRRTIVWDEENRIQSLFDNGHEKTYKYNDAGERVIKRGPQGETAYVNQYFTMRNREVGTKHVFVGNSKIVSKLMKQDKPGSNPGGNPPVEKDRYFFHPDHLGSTNYVTDANGQLYEHLEYFPSGETWVEESSNTQRTPYLFTSKELDEETGLYYFGARYYDPRTSVWQSPDVAMERYLNGLSMGGIYNSGNLNLYAYGYQNPVKYTDPNGQWLETAWDAFNIGLGVASLVDNVRQGNYLSAAVDAVGVVADTAAAVVPIVPGGVGSALKAARAADKGIDALKAADKAVDVTKSVDKAVDTAKAADKSTDVAKSTDKAVDAGSGSTFRSKTGPGGRLESVEARVGPKDIGTGTATNQGSRDLARGLGKSNDDAGHALGRKLGGKGDGQSGNIFPQNSNINRGAYRQHEADVADYIQRTGQTVDVKVSPIYRSPTDTRPIGVTYEVTRNGEHVLPPRTFLNP